MNSIPNIFLFIREPVFEGPWLVVKIVFIVISIYLLVWIVVLLLKTKWFRLRFSGDAAEFLGYRSVGPRKATKRWRRISRRLASGKKEEYKLAIVEADRFLDEVLTKIGYQGKTMADRLEQITQSNLSSVDSVREAHTIRNTIMHEPDYDITLDETKRVLDIYEKALREVEML